MKSARMIVLAAVMAGTMGAGSAHASANADVYSFFAEEKARRETAAAQAKAPQTVEKAVGEKAEKGRQAAPARRTARRKPAEAAAPQAPRRTITPREIAPPHLAQTGARGGRTATARVAAGKPLGYHGGSRERFRALIARHAAANGIPFALGDAVVRVESRYQPHVSNRGALGLMQIKHATARGLGYGGSAKGLMDPETNIKYGMKYLAQAYRLADGDTCGTVMRYQSGHYARRINRANLAYCAKVRTIMASLGTELASVETPAAASRVE